MVKDKTIGAMGRYGPCSIARSRFRLSKGSKLGDMVDLYQVFFHDINIQIYQICNDIDNRGGNVGKLSLISPRESA